MPEIKHTFTGGKMNKDLDERLIKSGEYRDAMNIQVTTSEGSDVGTMQNVLGNTEACGNLNYIPDNSYTVGSISDEKNDTLYWLVAGGAFSGLQQHLYDAHSNTYSASTAVGDVLYSKDLIMRKTANGCEPVFVDIYGFALANNESILGDGNATEGVANTLVIPVEYDNGKPLLSQVEVGMTVHGLDETLTPNTDTANVIGVGPINKIDTIYTPNTYSCQGNVLAAGYGIDGDDGASGGFEVDSSAEAITSYYGSLANHGPFIPNGNIIIHVDALNAITQNVITTFADNAGVSGGLRVGDQISMQNGSITGQSDMVFQNATVTAIEGVGSEWKRIIHDIPFSAWNGDWDTSCTGMNNGPDCANVPFVTESYNSSVNVAFSTEANINNLDPFTPGSLITVTRDATCFHPYIDLPSNSQWLDEIYSAFFNDDTSYIQGSQVKLKANAAWTDTGDGYAGCIDWETTYDASSGYALKGPTTNRLYIADCGNSAIPVTPMSTYNYLSLVQLSDSFVENVVWLDKEIDLGTNTAYFNFQRDRVLNFRADRLITGINVIDDMLFWTDGHTEPKKINIPRSLSGTPTYGTTHTRVVKDTLITNLPVLEEHVTVIKQSPTNPLTMELSTSRDTTHTHTGVMTISTESTQPQSSFVGGDGSSSTTDHYDFSALTVGDFFNVEIDSNIYGDVDFTLRQVDGARWKPGTRVVFKEFDEEQAPDIPILQYTIKATVGGWANNKMEATDGDPARVSFRIDFIEGSIPSTSSILKFAVDVLDESEKLFEFKFPRFSYRYKYADGEYSAFAPFTDVAFIPGPFSYHPRNGYNLGMTNRVKDVTIKNFITPSTPEDVVAIDILYKDDQSPNIYVVDTMTHNDETVDGYNEWQANEYKINSDIIHSVLPANQLLRPWDNVPKKAVAQEITKNRLVYANYTQGYDLTVGGKNIKPQFKHSLVNNKNSIKSIKSLREYQLGVVFVDKYGRETPVITNRSGGFKVGKGESLNKNQLKVGLGEMTMPSGIEYFKFFVKETSGEYYNMAMDRWYDAGDGSVWLAFPSSDRNKIDEDTFLVLKKGVESSSLVKEPARYKVVSIENQAPDFIKTTKYNIGDVQQDAGAGNEDTFLYGNGMDNAPKRGRNNFNCLASRFNGTSLSKIEDIKDELYVEFYLQGKPGVSHRYKINSATRDADDSNNTSGTFNFTIDGYFGDDVNFIFKGPINSQSGVKANAKTRFYKGVLENGAKFDGKFFVKIHADDHFNNYIANPPVTDDDRVEYNGVDSKIIYYCAPNHHTIHDGDYGDDAVAFGDSGYIENTLATLKTNFPDDIGSINPALTSFNVVTVNLQNGEFFLNQAMGKETFPETLMWYMRNNSNAVQQLSSRDWWGSNIIGGKISYEPGAANANRAFFKNDITNIWSTDSKIPNVNDYDSYDPNNDTLGFSFLWGLQNDLTPRGEIGNDDDNGYEDVFFIDGGPIAGTVSSMDGYLYHVAYQGSDMNHGNRRTQSGIQNFTHTGQIDLGFGPIMPAKKYPGRANWEWGEKWVSGDAKDEVLDWHHYNEEIFDFNRDGSRYEDEGGYLYRLASGKKFHWLEDPTKTIYTVEKATQRSNRVRTTGEGSITDGLSFLPSLFRNSEGDIYKHAAANLASRMAHPLYYTGENFSKSNIATFSPAMTNWEPTNYDNGGVGPIAGGRYVGIEVDPTSSLASTPSSRIKSIADSWNNNSFKVLKSHINHAWDSNNGITLSASGGEIPGEYTSVVEGMILTHLEQIGGTTSAVTNVTNTNGTFLRTPLLIDSITEAGDNYIINIVGYQHTDSTTDTAGLEQLNDHSDDGVFNLVFQQPAMNGLSVNSVKNLNRESYSTADNYIGLGAVGYTLEFLEPVERDTLLPKNPSVWETEPKESTDLDIYYEISGKNPARLNKDTIKVAVPIGSTVSVGNQTNTLISAPTVIGYTTTPNKTLVLNTPVCIGGGTYGVFAFSGCPGGTMPIDIGNDDITITRPDGSEITARVEDFVEVAGTPGLANKIVLKENISNSSYTLSWHNCYSFGNGVESNRIRDSFNLPYITSGVKASTTLEGKYKEEHRKYGLIYSGIYNSTSGINNLNQFIQAEKITKDVNPVYGSIQKLHTRDSNLIALCEDKILKILAHKDALYNADGNPQLVATDKVLGQTTPFVGEYGISKNPESFASESYRAYFTDKVRGAVMRLSKDGLTAISDAGMKDWFRDNLKLNSKLVGSYDDYKGEYNVTLTQTADPNNAKSVTYREDIRGWVSFKSFVPENGLSCANEYYTFNNGLLWKHHDETQDRNTFYKDAITTGFTASSVNVILNESPGTIKTFHTLNYEGTQSKVNTFTDYNTYFPGTSVVDAGIYNNEYYNLEDKPGWSVEHVQTDQEEGSLNEFIEKEGKWFNYIRGKAGSVTDGANITSGFNNADFSFQGIGVLSENATSVNIVGCTDPLYTEYDENAVIEDGSCYTLIVLGCTDPAADGGNNMGNSPNTDDGSCIYYGCPDNYTVDGCGVGCNGALNFDGINYTDNGSCAYCVYGCMTPGQFNYDVLNTCVNVPDSCVPIILGCISDPNATNFAGVGNTNGVNPPANTPDPLNPCFTEVLGCIDVLACNTTPGANTTDNSCLYCGDTGTDVDNYDGGSCNTGCLYCTEVSSFAIDSFTDTEINLSWTAPSGSNVATLTGYTITYINNTTQVSTTAFPQPTDTTWPITGLDENTSYDISISATCSNSDSLEETISQTTAITQVYGCMDSQAWNFAGVGNTNGLPVANAEDGTCIYEGCIDSTSLNGITTFNHPNPGTFYTNPINATIQDNPSTCVAIVNGCTDATAFNYDEDANVDDGSCVAEVLGCTDDSLNNSGTTAATNYNSSANVDDGSCTYIYPTLYNAVPLGMQAPLLNTVGWTTTTLWSGNSRVVFAVWDVSASPAIDKNNLQFAYENSAGSNAGDITNFTSQVSWWYSVDDGANWSSGNGFTNGGNIQLIRFRFSSFSGAVQFLPSATRAALYPPIASNGAQKQAAKIGFTNANIPTYTTGVETYNVMLGCNDSSAWAGYVNDIPFYDNDGQCATVGTVDNIAVTSVTYSPSGGTAWHVNADIDWDYLFPINESTWDVNTYGAYPTPDDYEWQFGQTTGDGVASSFQFVGTIGLTYATDTFGTTTNPPISVQRLHYFGTPASSWNHFRVRWRKTINNVLEVGPWVDNWTQTPQ